MQIFKYIYIFMLSMVGGKRMKNDHELVSRRALLRAYVTRSKNI